ncbi:MAG TPA: YdeI/OmpD-associated family protein [Pirellulales bacterium]|jgi:uncharacterized protein YdeI (YjbR/CyaY-like superfamily)|nr:YdeI/OmpD-associated family protein [Pirellulales bacterium]
MAKKSAEVDVYIANAASFAKPILNHLRRAVLTACPQAEETLKWRCPHFVYGGKLLCSMATFKQHCALGFSHAGMKSALAEVEKDGAEQFQLDRIVDLSDLPSKAVIARLVKQAMQLTDDGIKSTTRSKRKTAKPVKVPADLQTALKKNKKAQAAFENFSPSHQREYVQWIVEAKRPETRLKCLQTTLQWLSSGKSRNWKYDRK